MSGTSGTIPTISGFTAGDIVISEVGGANAAQTGVNPDNAASPITLVEINPTTGAIVGEMVLPQTGSGNNDPISGEYGSSSEGTLALAGNGQSLVIAGYGVNATTYNQGGAATYGNAALAQSTSLTTQTTYTPVARVVADISYNGSVDTSTALFNIFNVNNPRSVATINGSVFYLAGQGNKDATQGVFEAVDGASSATAIDTANDARDVEIYNGQLYVSEDSKIGPTDGIATFGGVPTTASTPTFLSGIETSTVLTAATANGVDDAAIGTSVNLSPENYFFANPTTLYVADGGDPKEGGLGDGGLQKWTLNTTTGVWSLDYTLSAGLPLSPNTASDGVSGLIGLTGTLNANGTVTLFATTEGIGDLDQTYLVTITDNVANTIAPSTESFAILETANSGYASTANIASVANTSGTVNIRGIAEAPSAPTSTTISGGQTTAAGTTVSNGSVLTVLAGGTASAVVVNSAGQLFISSGGVETGSLIATGGSEMIAGSATGDTVFGTQFVSATGAASGEVVSYGGIVAAYAGASISATTVAAGGELLVSAAAASNAVIAGGEIVVEGSGGQIAGGVTFSGGGELIMAGNNGLGGLTAVIADFAGADAIDLAFIGAGATLTSSNAGGNTDLAVTSGGVTESFVLSGNYEPGSLVLKADATSGVEIAVQSSVLSGTMTVSSGNVSPDKVIGATLTGTINSGGTAISTTIQSGGLGVVSGLDLAATVQAGGSEIVYGSASGDVIYGTQNVSSAAATGNGAVTNETVGSGGQIDLFIKGGAATSTFVESAGAIFISGNAQASNTVLSGGSIVLESGKSELTGGVIFDGAGAIVYSTFVSASGSSGDLAVLSGFGVDDVISFTSAAVGLSGTLTITSGANTTATISGTGGSETLIFAGSGVPLVYNANVSGGGTLTEGTISSGGSTGSSGTGSSGTGSSGTGSSGTGSMVSTNIVSGGQVITIGAGGTELSGTILSGGSIVVSASGFDSGTTIDAGGSELVFGTASGDAVSGAQMISANAYYETVYSGGAAELLYKGAIGSGLTVLGGGSIYINGRGSATNIVLDGGAIVFDSPKATTFGTLDFATSGALVIETATSALTVGSSWGPEAVISNFGGGDVVDITAFGYAGAIFTSGTSGGNTVVTVSSGTGTQSEEILTFAGTNPGAIQLVSGASGEAELVVSVTSVTSAVTVSSGTSLVNFTVASGGSVTVTSGATVSNGSVTSGAVIVSGGTDIHLQVGAGGSETLTGSGAADVGGIVTSGGTVLLTSGATTSNITLAGGNLLAGPGTTQDPTTISSGSTDTFSGAAGTGTVILSGGAEVLISGGVESGGSDAGLLVLSNGGTAIGETVSAGGLISGVVGGTLISGVVLAGGSVVMSSYDSGTVISAGGSELLMGSGSGDIVAGSQLISGPLDVVNSETVLSGGVVNISTTSAVTSGDIIMSGGTIIDNGRNYVDNLTISGGTLVLDSAKATTSGTITFAGSGGLIDVAVTPSLTSSSFSLNSATVIGFTAGDVVEAGFVSYTGATLTSSGSGGNTIVTISGTGGAESFVLSGTHAAGFALVNEGGFAAATANPCYCTGTRILGVSGEIAVEDIKVGDELVTVRDGGPLSAKVIWTGKRDLDLLRRPDAETLYPVRITAGAIAPGLPERDLRVSPNHAIYLDGLLFEAQALVNGTTIFRETATRFVTYHHIELAAHDIILAEGVPAESYLDTGNRNAFDTEDCTALFPDFGKPLTAKTCVPLISEGAALEQVQAKLVRRAKAA
jgi:autotransporter passenger strand-loop-strand repeat protein